MFLKNFLLLPVLLTSQIALAEECQSSNFDLVTSVRQVVDGDTLVLDNGTHLRFIGINTPELARKPGHSYGPDRDQPLAKAATSLLKETIGNKKIKVIYGKEKEDRYGRLLGHPFTEGGVNLTSYLLENGMGFAVTISPNLRFAGCYNEMEQKARGELKGVWKIKEYEAISSGSLKGKNIRGFARVYGRVNEIESSRRGVWIKFNGDMAVLIPYKSVYLFNNISEYYDSSLEARGWLIDRGKKTKPWYKRWMMVISHPNMLRKNK